MNQKIPSEVSFLVKNTSFSSTNVAETKLAFTGARASHGSRWGRGRWKSWLRRVKAVKIHGKSMRIHENPWFLMGKSDIYDIYRFYSTENLWKSMENPWEHPWFFMGRSYMCKLELNEKPPCSSIFSSIFKKRRMFNSKLSNYRKVYALNMF